MKRALINQMAHDWKNNIWLVIELAIVGLAIWAIMILIWLHCKGLVQPLGFNPENVYTLEVKSVPETSPYFLTDYKDKFYEERDILIDRLRRDPNIAAVSLHNNFAPFEYNYAGNYFSVEDWPDSIGYYGNIRVGEPDIVNVLEIHSTTGKSQAELTKMMERGEVLISPHDELEAVMGPMKDLIGKKIYLGMDSTKARVVGDVVDRVRRSEYEYTTNGVVIMPYDNVHKDWGDVILRLKPGKEQDFINNLDSDPSLTKQRNVYLSNLKSLVKKGKTLDKEIEINVRVMVGISFFLLVTIFLGLLGSFWFRVQQRTSEIAIRKTFGAKDSDLFRRIIGEGLLLLLLSMLLISACVWPFIDELTDYLGEEWWVFLVFEGIMTGMLCVGIIGSLLYPAYKAMHIEPAIAVKED